MILNSKIYTYFFLFGLLSSIVLPPFPIGDSYSIYMVTLFSAVLSIPACLVLLSTGLMSKASVYVLLLAVMVVVSSLYSIVIDFTLYNLSDFIETVKYLQFVPYLLLIPFLRISLKSIDKFISFAGVFFVLIGLIQVLKVPILNDILLNAYLGDDSNHIDKALAGHRITLTGSDPNIGATICAFFAFYFLYTFIYEKKYTSLFLTFVVVFLLVLTQSRTVILGFIFAFCVWVFFYSRMTFLVKVMLLVFVVIFASSIVFFLNLEYVIIGLTMAASGENNSLNVRFQNFYDALELFKMSPVFGIGPAKSVLSTIIDSEYALILQRYGLIGIILFFGYLFFLYRLAKRTLNQKWGSILISFIFLSLVVMATNNIFSGYQLMSIIVLLNSICYWLVFKRVNSTYNYNASTSS